MKSILLSFRSLDVDVEDQRFVCELSRLGFSLLVSDTKWVIIMLMAPACDRTAANHSIAVTAISLYWFEAWALLIDR